MHAIPITTLLSVDPSVAKRAQRVQFAVDLIRHNCPPREARRRVQQQFRCSVATAWRTVSMAQDLAA